MQTRAARLVLFALLLAVGIGAGVLTWNLERRIRALDTAERDVTSQVDRLVDHLTDIAAAQAGYVAPGQSDQLWMERVTDDLQRLTADAQALRPRTRSVEAAPRLQALGDSIGKLSRTDAAIRDSLRAGETIPASVAIFNDSRRALEAMTASLRHLRDAESVAFLMEREALVEQAAIALAVAALLWIGGLALLVRVPAPAAAGPIPSPAPLPIADAEPAQTAAPASAPAAIDLAAAADVCTALSRVAATQELPALLARVAAIVDASGVIVWLGAGEELFAVTAHGYDPRVISRLGPIGRSADNATAAAWRAGELRTVAGDMMANGAIVAPMFGPDACIGVLAAEVRHGREEDPATRAVTMMIAAQLATVVAAWPAASSQHEPKAV
jgi:hypothetical protein